MRRLVWLLLALELLAPAVSSAAPAAQVRRQQEQTQALSFTTHALARMEERGVSREQVLRAVERGESFPYYHQSVWKTGYYDPGQKLFLATDQAVVITVITGATRGYVERLKRKKP